MEYDLVFLIDIYFFKFCKLKNVIMYKVKNLCVVNSYEKLSGRNVLTKFYLS